VGLPVLAVVLPDFTVTDVNWGSIDSLKVSATSGGTAVSVEPEVGLERTSAAWAEAGSAPARASTAATQATREARRALVGEMTARAEITCPSCPRPLTGACEGVVGAPLTSR